MYKKERERERDQEREKAHFLFIRSVFSVSEECRCLRFDSHDDTNRRKEK